MDTFACLSLAVQVRAHLTDDLLAPKYRALRATPTGATFPGTFGHCYVASEALYHLTGGARGPLRPVCATIDGCTHWWLRTFTLPEERPDIYDLTYDQFSADLRRQFYQAGKPKGFLTKGPSKRARTLMDRVRQATPTMESRQ